LRGLEGPLKKQHAIKKKNTAEDLPHDSFKHQEALSSQQQEAVSS
jgi:hypothetical protein